VKMRRLRLMVGGFLFGVYHLNLLSHFWGAVHDDVTGSLTLDWNPVQWNGCLVNSILKKFLRR